MIKVKESKVQKDIQNWLTKRGYYNRKSIGMNKAGFPDIVCCMKGRFLGIEVKGTKFTADPIQELNLNMIRQSGGIGVVLNFYNWRTQLEKIEKEILCI